MEHPGQAVLTAGQVLWTAECEKALADAEQGPRRALKALRKKWVSYLTRLTAVTRERLEAVDRAKVLGCSMWMGGEGRGGAAGRGHG